MQIILDANLGLYKSCHIPALADKTNKRGIPTGPAYGFLKSLSPLLEQLKADSCIAVFDGGRSKRRLVVMPDYKAGRKHDAALLVLLKTQRALLQRLLPGLGVPVVLLPGKEGDDIIAHIVDYGGDETIIVSEDADLLQCVRTGVSVFRPGKDHLGLGLVTEENFKQVTGVRQDLYCLYKAVVGDVSDGLPGVHGVGPKTVIPLLEQMTSSDPQELLNLSASSSSVKLQKIAVNSSSLHTGLEMVDLRREVFSENEEQEIDRCLEEASYDVSFITKQFVDLEFKSILDNLTNWLLPFRRLRKY